MDINSYKPTGKFNQKHLLTLKDYSAEDIFEVLYEAKKIKEEFKSGIKNSVLKDKTIALIFAKSSTRTRVSFELGIRQLGGEALFLSGNDIQLGRGETIHDTVKVLQSYNIDGIMIRTFKQSDVSDLAKFGNIPIINGLTDLCHPCQVLADLLTIWEHKGTLNGLKLCYFGDGNNMANSLLIGDAKCGINVTIACPKGFEPDKDFVEEAKKYSNIIVTDDPIQAAKDCDVLYTDVFFSMGQQIEKSKYDAMIKFQVNSATLKLAKKDAIFLHCLPAHRGEEVTADVIDNEDVSLIFKQAENRLHAQKGVMSLLFKK